MRVTTEDMDHFGGDANKLFTDINDYVARANQVWNFIAGDHSPEVLMGLVRMACAIAGMEMIPAYSTCGRRSYWQSFTDRSVEPPETYWLVPKNSL